MNASGARANKPELVRIHGWGLGPAAWDAALAALYEKRYQTWHKLYPALRAL